MNIEPPETDLPSFPVRGDERSDDPLISIRDRSPWILTLSSLMAHCFPDTAGELSNYPPPCKVLCLSDVLVTSTLLSFDRLLYELSIVNEHF